MEGSGRVLSLFDVQSRFLSEGTGEKYGQL